MKFGFLVLMVLGSLGFAAPLDEETKVVVEQLLRLNDGMKKQMQAIQEEKEKLRQENGALVGQLSKVETLSTGTLDLFKAALANLDSAHKEAVVAQQTINSERTEKAAAQKEAQTWRARALFLMIPASLLVGVFTLISLYKSSFSQTLPLWWKLALAAAASSATYVLLLKY